MIHIKPELNIASKNKGIIDKISCELGKEDKNKCLLIHLISLWEDGLYSINAPSKYGRINSLSTLKHSILLFPYYIAFIILKIAEIEEDIFLSKYANTTVLQHLVPVKSIYKYYLDINNINKDPKLEEVFLSIKDYKTLQEYADKIFGVSFEIRDNFYQTLESLLLSLSYPEEAVFNYISIVSTDNKSLLTTKILQDQGVEKFSYITNLISNWQIDESKIFRLSR
jgi:hypothetical protein